MIITICDIDGFEIQRYSQTDSEPCGSNGPEGMTPKRCNDCDGLGFVEKPS